VARPRQDPRVYGATAGASRSEAALDRDVQGPAGERQTGLSISRDFPAPRNIESGQGKTL
jgi:hypothetical protein